MEEPRYADINEAEVKEIEAELGHPVTRELAQWFIRNRINRDAVERMLAASTARSPAVQNIRKIERSKVRTAVSAQKKAKKKCA